jgi:hypothetical protein
MSVHDRVRYMRISNLKVLEHGGILAVEIIATLVKLSLTLTSKPLLIGEVIMYDNQIVLYRSNIDIFFYVVASADENELMISSMLNAFYDAVSTLLRLV